MTRCPWPAKPLDILYHDAEWGVPLHDDRALFELLILEGAQAGLSWSTILAKRENYRRAFDAFDTKKIARYDAQKVAALLADAAHKPRNNGIGEVFNVFADTQKSQRNLENPAQ